MRTKRNGYGARESYAGYGLTRERVNALLKECRAGEHADILQTAAQQAEPDIAKWIVSSIIEGKSFDRMAVRWELGEAEVMPCCRNSFYAYRKFTLAILDNMLSRKETGEYGKL